MEPIHDIMGASLTLASLDIFDYTGFNCKKQVESPWQWASFVHIRSLYGYRGTNSQFTEQRIELLKIKIDDFEWQESPYEDLGHFWTRSALWPPSLCTGLMDLTISQRQNWASGFAVDVARFPPTTFPWFPKRGWGGDGWCDGWRRWGREFHVWAGEWSVEGFVSGVQKRFAFAADGYSRQFTWTPWRCRPFYFRLLSASPRLRLLAAASAPCGWHRRLC